MKLHYSQAKANVKRLKLVEKTPPNKLHLGAAPPPVDLKPGDYIAQCRNVWIENTARGLRVVWQFVLQDGAHHGIGLRKWKSFDGSGEVPYGSEYARACEIGLGRALDDDDDLGHPEAIFKDKLFVVKIGFRKTATPKGGVPSDENALRKKDSEDKLRVHEILSLIE